MQAYGLRPNDTVQPLEQTMQRVRLASRGMGEVDMPQLPMLCQRWHDSVLSVMDW